MIVRRRSSAAAGFTLVEVLAALVLVGIVLPVAMKGISLSLATASIAKRQAEAASLAQDKLNELVTLGEWQGAGLRGEFAPEHPEYRWTADVVEQDAGLTQVDVQVTWLGRDGERSVKLSTLVYTPGME